MKNFSRIMSLACFLALVLCFFTSVPASAGDLDLRVIIIGDDFTNGSGIENQDDWFLTILNKKFNNKKLQFKQYSENGATTATAISLMDRIIREKPDMVMLAVGANDALTGADPDIVYSNLDTLVRELLRNNIYVIVLSVQAPPTVSQDYAMLFNGIFPRLSSQHRVMMLDGVYQSYMGNRDLTQYDLIHPNKQGVQMMLKIVRKAFDEEFIKTFRKAKSRAQEMAN